MKKKGFTLIELLVVIAIIGLLSTLAIMSLSNARAKGRDGKKFASLKSLRTVIEIYKVESSNGSAPSPSSWTEFESILSAKLPNGLPKSPDANKFIYCHGKQDAGEGAKYLLAVTLENDANNGLSGQVSASVFDQNRCITEDNKPVSELPKCDHGKFFCLGYLE